MKWVLIKANRLQSVLSNDLHRIKHEPYSVLPPSCPPTPPTPSSLCPFHAPAEYSKGNHTEVSLFEDIFKFCSRVRATLLHSCLESLLWLYKYKRGSSWLSPQSVSTCNPGVVKIIGQQLWQDSSMAGSVTQGIVCTSVFTLDLHQLNNACFVQFAWCWQRCEIPGI